MAEIMLQQTQTDRVVKKWPHFFAGFPNLRRLAGASLRQVQLAWAGMGYNNRAVRLHRCAQLVMTGYGGTIPSDPAILLKLPGIGKYTAHAVACFAFGAPVPLVDINVRRLFTRLFAKHRRTSALIGDERAWRIASAVLPSDRAYDWNQALMDLGATVCMKKNPRCAVCPLNRLCRSAFLLKSADPPKQSEPLVMGTPRRLIRGAILRELRRKKGHRAEVGDLLRSMRMSHKGIRREDLDPILTFMEGDGLIRIRAKHSRFAIVELA